MGTGKTGGGSRKNISFPVLSILENTDVIRYGFCSGREGVISWDIIAEQYTTKYIVWVSVWLPNIYLKIWSWSERPQKNLHHSLRCGRKFYYHITYGSCYGQEPIIILQIIQCWGWLPSPVQRMHILRQSRLYRLPYMAIVVVFSSENSQAAWMDSIQ